MPVAGTAAAQMIVIRLGPFLPLKSDFAQLKETYFCQTLKNCRICLLTSSMTSGSRSGSRSQRLIHTEMGRQNWAAMILSRIHIS